MFHDLRVHQAELEMQNEELRQAQAALDTARARYFDFYDLAPVGYLSVNARGLIEQANLATATLLGMARGALIKQPISHFILKADQEIFYLYRQQIIDTGQHQPCELRMTKADGTPFCGQLESIAVPNEAGAPTLRIVLSDFSERKRDEMALREQKEFFHLIAESIGDFIAVLDLEGRRLYSSPSYKRFFGGARDLRGTDSFAEIHPQDQERVKQVFRETVQTGLGRRLHYRFLTVDGSIREMESLGSVIRDDEGKVARVVVISHDITERKQMEEEIHQLAFYDPLTKLPNRRLLNDRLGQTMAANKRSGCYGALMFLDLDNFKLLNDRQGHEAGDLLLTQVANRLRSCVREMDTVARFGGDEFVVVISELDVDKAESTAQATIVAEKILATLSECYLLTIRQAGKADAMIEHHCTASIGVTLFIDQEPSQDDILKWADAAMYQAKAAGGNLIRFYDPQT
jgi:diguanylate cyclase (GGDEF)-like protein/PAS domain S-box-containing protein